MPKYPFKFPVSGKEIFIKKVPQMILDDVQRAIPRPKPPMQKVTIGDEVREEPNLAHPAYTEALLDWDRTVQVRTMEVIVRLGVKYSLTDEDRVDLQEIKAFYEETGLTLSGKTETENWISYVAAVAKEDFEALIQEVMSLSAPTPKSN